MREEEKGYNPPVVGKVIKERELRNNKSEKNNAGEETKRWSRERKGTRRILGEGGKKERGKKEEPITNQAKMPGGADPWGCEAKKGELKEK